MLLSNWSFGAVLISATALLLPGCGPKPSGDKTAPHADEHAHDEHGHPEEGPHHGHLIELGKEEYHAELTHDEASKTVTIYLLDGGAKKAVPIAESEIVVNLVVNGTPVQAKLAAAPQDGDPSGHASRFSLVDEKVLEALEAEKTTGRLNVTIAGKPYSGQIEHHEHAEHDQK